MAKKRSSNVSLFGLPAYPLAHVCFRENEPFIMQSGKNSFHALSMRAIKIEIKNHMKYKRLIFTKSIRFHISGIYAIDFSHKNTPKMLDFEKNFQLQNPIICGR
jgi:hypothetical protein